MSEQPQDFGECYRLLGIRKDGTRATVLGRMTWDEAKRAQEAIEKAEIFDSIRVELESSDEIPTLE